MKRLFGLCCIVLIGTLLTPWSSFAFHNNFYSATWTCELCHPGGPHAHIPECIECHDNATGANFTDTDAPEMTTHSSAAMGDRATPAYGDWQQECVACHEPHHHNGITMRGDVQPSTPSRVLVEFTGNYAVTVDHKTTLEIVSPITANDTEWADPATWGAKTGNPERGLVLLIVIQGKTYTYEVLNATANSITFSSGWAWFPQAPYSNPIPMRLVYGMFIQEEVGPYPVVYSGPKSMGYNEAGVSVDDPTPTGICQVCHTQTKFWRNDGTLTNHNNGNDCIDCHHHEEGFRPPGGGGPS